MELNFSTVADKRILFNTRTSKVNNVIKKSWSLDNHDTVNEGDNDSKESDNDSSVRSQRDF